jgi:hypothetical protein
MLSLREVTVCGDAAEYGVHDGARLVIADDMPEDSHEQHGDRLREVQRPGGSSQDRRRVPHVRVDVIARPLRRGSQQRPRVRQHQRVVVHVDHPGLRRDDPVLQP